MESVTLITKVERKTVENARGHYVPYRSRPGQRVAEQARIITFVDLRKGKINLAFTKEAEHVIGAPISTLFRDLEQARKNYIQCQEKLREARGKLYSYRDMGPLQRVKFLLGWNPA